jgi:hypothetical protein
MKRGLLILVVVTGLLAAGTLIFFHVMSDDYVNQASFRAIRLGMTEEEVIRAVGKEPFYHDEGSARDSALIRKEGEDTISTKQHDAVMRSTAKWSFRDAKTKQPLGMTLRWVGYRYGISVLLRDDKVIGKFYWRVYRKTWLDSVFDF